MSVTSCGSYSYPCQWNLPDNWHRGSVLVGLRDTEVFLTHSYEGRGGDSEGRFFQLGLRTRKRNADWRSKFLLPLPPSVICCGVPSGLALPPRETSCLWSSTAFGWRSSLLPREIQCSLNSSCCGSMHTGHKPKINLFSVLFSEIKSPLPLHTDTCPVIYCSFWRTGDSQYYRNVSTSFYRILPAPLLYPIQKVLLDTAVWFLHANKPHSIDKWSPEG